MAYYKCGKIFATQNSNTSIETASGAIANFRTSLAVPVLGCNAEFSASQASGTPTPSTPIPIVGVDKVNVTRCGKNLCGGSKLLANAQAYLTGGTTDTENKTFTFNANATTTSGLSFTSGVKFKENTAYTFILTCSKSNTTVGTNIRFLYTDGTTANLSLNEPTTADTKYTKAFTSNASKTLDKILKTNMSGITTLYYDECGVFEGTLTAQDFEPYNGTTAIINLGGTYYGGEVDAVTGKITLDHGLNTFDGSENWSATDTHIFRLITTGRNWLPVNAANWALGYLSNILRTDIRATGATSDKLPDHSFYITSQYLYVRCDEYELADFKTALGSTNLQIDAPLATPIVVYASNTAEIPTINGDNQVFADTGDVAVKYRKLHSDN